MKKIIQFWDGNIPNDVSSLMNTWKVNNPDCEYQLYNYEDACHFINEHFSADVANAFKLITIPAMICDVFRVAVILKLGGIYVDCGTESFAPISSIVTDWDKCTFLRKHNGWIWNGLIIAKKDNPIIIELWNKIEKVLLEKKEGNIWALTGPKIFMDVTNENVEVDLKFDKTEINQSFDSHLISILEQVSSKPFFTIVNKLKHKGVKHWSKLQQVLPLFAEKRILPNKRFNKKIVIHLGQHKTGCTEIQRSLTTVRSKIPEVLYPTVGAAHAGHHSLSDLFSKNEMQEIEVFFENFISEVSTTNAEVVILSSEYFSSANELIFNKKRMNNIWMNLSIICELFKESQLVLYVREQVSSIESRINQAIESRLCLTNINVNNFLSNPSLDYNLFDEALRYYFPNSEITPRVFSKNTLVDSDICRDFSSLFTFLDLNKININERILSEELMLRFIEINKKKIDVDKKMELKRLAKEEYEEEIKLDTQTSSLLTDEQKEEISKFYIQSNREFFYKYKSAGEF